jgi:hypothetical protein
VTVRDRRQANRIVSLHGFFQSMQAWSSSCALCPEPKPTRALLIEGVAKGETALGLCNNVLDLRAASTTYWRMLACIKKHHEKVCDRSVGKFRIGRYADVWRD